MHLPLLLSALLLPLAQCTHLRILVPSTPSLPNPAYLPPSTQASLTTTEHILHAPLRADNSFDFRNVSAGSYLLDIHSHSHAFAPLRVDVAGHAEQEHIPEVQVWGTFRGNEWSNKGEAVEVWNLKAEEKGAAPVWAFAAKSAAKKEYLVERQGFSALNILKSPMILLALGSLVVVFGMPYLMENMDPDLRAEFEERQKSSPLTGGQAAQNPLQNFDAAAWLAGNTSPKSESSGAQKSQAPVERGVTR